MTAAPVLTESIESRQYYPDAVRALGTIAVVAIHVTGSGVALFDTTGTDGAGWWIYNGVNSACRWAVPVFVMLSGALLLDPVKASESAGEFYHKRLARIGTPLFFWSAFYLWLRWFAPGHDTPPPVALEDAIKPILFANPYYHLYFLFVMLSLYLFTPALRALTAHIPIPTVRGYAVAALALACGDTFVRNRYGFPTNTFSMGAAYLGYFLLGYGLRDVALSPRNRWVYGLLLVVTVAVTALGTAWTMARWQSGGLRQYLYNFFSPTVCVMAVCVFVLLAGARYDSPVARLLRPVVRLLSDTSLGVYLVHPLILLLAHRYGFEAARMEWWIYLPGVTVGVLATSVLITWLIQVTRIARPLVG